MPESKQSGRPAALHKSQAGREKEEEGKDFPAHRMFWLLIVREVGR